MYVQTYVMISGQLSLTLDRTPTVNEDVVFATYLSDNSQADEIVFSLFMNDAPVTIITEQQSTTTSAACNCTHVCSRVTFRADRKYDGLPLICATPNTTLTQSSLLLSFKRK